MCYMNTCDDWCLIDHWDTALSFRLCCDERFVFTYQMILAQLEGSSSPSSCLSSQRQWDHLHCDCTSERGPYICNSKQNIDRRDQNTNSLITPVKLFVDVCSQPYSLSHLVQQWLSEPKLKTKTNLLFVVMQFLRFHDSCNSQADSIHQL